MIRRKNHPKWYAVTSMGTDFIAKVLKTRLENLRLTARRIFETDSVCQTPSLKFAHLREFETDHEHILVSPWTLLTVPYCSLLNFFQTDNLRLMVADLRRENNRSKPPPGCLWITPPKPSENVSLTPFYKSTWDWRCWSTNGTFRRFHTLKIGFAPPWAPVSPEGTPKASDSRRLQLIFD